jgi:bisphosphoglycerate-independent phosphoglycerate mutase (AlkP superfamily)
MSSLHGIPRRAVALIVLDGFGINPGCLNNAVAHDNSVILTADHGNCEEMIDPLTDEPHTQHTV